MRLFLAVAPGQDWCHELSSRVDLLRTELEDEPSLRWVRPDAWHLTLQFLGEWPESRIPALENRLRESTWGFPFQVRTGDPGAFPDLQGPRVLFLHQHSAGSAEDLARHIRREVAAAWPDGPQDERPFLAHLTLARMKSPLAAGTLSALRRWHPEELPPWPVQSFQLMSSELKSPGPEHRVRLSIPLQKA